MSTLLNSVKSTFTLNDGVKIPVIGYGTYFEPIAKSPSMDEIQEKHYQMVKSYFKSVLVDNGYIHIDTAEMYQSEGVIGRAIEELNIDRSKIFITSKIWLLNSKIRIGRKETLNTVSNSLKYLNTDYIDLFLIHSPHSFTNDGKDIIEIYETLLQLKKEGKIRSIGVSNFGVSHLKTIIETYRLPPPSVNQIRLHPFARDLELLNYCKKYGITMEAYSPLFQGNKFKFRGFDKEISVFDHPVLTYIGDKYNKNAAQILLRWSIQMGYVPIFKSTKPERIRRYTNIFDFNLDEREMKMINLLNEGYHANIGWHPMLTEKWDYKVTSKL